MSLRKARAAKGLCPECGEEAAPYYLCGNCHGLRQLTKILKVMDRDGYIETTRDPTDRRRYCYWVTGKDGTPTIPARMLDFGERGKPRLRGVPVDVEAELFGIFERAGRPLMIEEIREAWVKLRPRPSRPAADALASIIAAEDKRARKRARNAALATGG